MPVDVQLITMASLTSKSAPGYRLRVQGLTAAMETMGLELEISDLSIGPMRSIEILSYISYKNCSKLKDIFSTFGGEVVL